MSAEQSRPTPSEQRHSHILTLNYVSFYLKDLEDAVDFYSRVFGPPQSVDEKLRIYGFRMGTTWLTLLPSRAGTHPDSNPRNTEFAIQVASVEEVDRLYAEFIAAGARECRSPRNTSMYEPMRFSCVDDPFGVRIDVYCLLDKAP